MKTKVLQVFYNENGLPFKDQERTVHFPIVGSGFMGASNTTQIKFYFKEIGDDTVKYVAVSKLPNGKVGSKVLENYFDTELNEPYALLELDSYYTQYKGDLFISLQGYQGGVQVTYDEESSQYEIHGTPTIAATGSIKFTINYANQFVGSGETDNINFQRILAALGTKLGMRAYSEHVEELPSEGSPDVFYVVNDDPNNPNLANIYVWNENTGHYIWVGDNTLDLGEYYTKNQGEQFENNIGNRVTSVENELSSVAQGSPKGVYATLSDLESAYPTGTNGIYVVSANGHWYFWNGSAWTDGGVYQATGIDGNSIDNIKLKDKCVNVRTTEYLEIGKNLFNFHTAVLGKVMNYNNGAITTDASYFMSDLIPVEESTAYIFNHNYTHVCFLDKNGDYLSGTLIGSSIASFTTPSNCKYVVVSSNLGGRFADQLEKGSTVTTFEEYKATIKEYIKVSEKSLPKDEIAIGKNLFNKETVSKGFYIDETNGNIVENSAYFTSAFIEIKYIGQYYVLNSHNVKIIWFDENLDYVSGNNTSTNYHFYARTGIVRISGLITELDAIQLELGIFSTKYEPYISYLKNNSYIKQSLNLFNPQTLLYGYIVNYSNGQKTAQADGRMSSFIEVNAGDEYYIKGTWIHVCFFNEYKRFISGNLIQGSANHFTAPVNAKYMIISGNVGFNTTVNVGNDFVSYAPYYWGVYNKENNKLLYGIGLFNFKVPVNKAIPLNGTSNETQQDSVDEVMVNACIFLPMEYSYKHKVKLTMLLHGNTYYVSESQWCSGQANGDLLSFANSVWVSQGHAVCDINGYDNTFTLATFGSPRTINAYRKLYEYVVSNFNVDLQLNVYGFSMGGINALNFAFQYKDIVKCVGLGAPCCSLYRQLWVEQNAVTLNVRKSIAVSYGFDNADDYTPTTTYGENIAQSELDYFNDNLYKTIGSDPFKHMLEIGGSSYIAQFPPIKIWHGTADTATFIQYSQELINAMQNGGCNAILRTVDGGVHSLSYGNNPLVVTELKIWFSRFNN